MKLIGMFLFSVTLTACSGTTRVVPKPPPTVASKTATTARRLREFTVLPAPPVEAIDTVIEVVITQAIVASAADQVHINVILGVLGRADLDEIEKIVRNDRIFPIQDLYQNIFWHAAIEMANIFLRHPDCLERGQFLEKEKPPDGFFQRRLKYLPSELQLLYRAAARFLVTKAGTNAYKCKAPPML